MTSRGDIMEYNIGNKIKELRVALGLTQEQLGEMVGVKKAAINKYEKGSVKNIKRTMQIELAKALQVKPFELFYGDSATTDMLTEEITNKLELLTEEQMVITILLVRPKIHALMMMKFLLGKHITIR